MTDATLHLKVNATEVDKGAKSLDQLAAAGGKAEKSTDALTKANATLSGSAKKAEQSIASLSNTTSMLVNAAKAAAAAFGLYKLAQYAQEAALLNARYETLGISMYQAGKNAGYMRSEMDAYQKALERTGISMSEARNTLIQMSSANMDLANTTKLARAAQDLAVVGNTNSSEAFNRLIHGIKSAQTETLRTLGINVSFEEGYKKLGLELHKNSNALTENEKLLARTNATMEAAAKYQGIYEQAMGTAGKQLGSLARYQENFKVIVGETFNEGLAFGVGAFTTALKDATTEAVSLKEKGDLKEWGRAAMLVLAGVADSARMVFNTLGAMGTVIERITVTAAILANPFASGVPRLRALQDDLKKQQAEFVAGMSDNLKVYNSVMEGFAKSDQVKLDAAKKSAQEYVDVPKAAAAAYLAYGDDIKNAEKAYIAVMEASNIEWKGRGKIIESVSKQSATDHQKAITSMIASLQKESDTYGMTAAQIKIYEAEKLKLTPAELAHAKALITGIAAREAATQAEKDAAKAASDASDEMSQMLAERQKQLAFGREAYNDYWASVDKTTESIVEGAKQLEWETSLIGKSKEAIAALTKEKENLALVQAENNLQLMIENREQPKAIGQQLMFIEALKRRRAAEEGKATGEATQAAIEKDIKAYEEQWKMIDGFAQTAFNNIFDKGKNVFKELGDAIKKYVLEMLYKMTIQKWIFNVGVTGAGVGASGSAMAGNMTYGAGMMPGLLGSGALGTFGTGIASAMQTGIVSGFTNGMTAIGLGQFSTGLGMMLPGVGVAIAGIMALKSLFGGSKGPKLTSTGHAVIDYSAAGQQTGYQSQYGVSNAQTDAIVAGMQKSYTDLAKSLGIGMAATQFGYASNIMSDGSKPQFGLHGGAAGGTLFRQGETAYSEDAVKLAASRAIFTALQGSELPQYLANVFKDLKADTMTQKDIDSTLEFASALKLVRDGLTETRTPLEIMTVNMNSGFAKLGTSADTFKKDFVAAIDAGLKPEQFQEWITLGTTIDSVAQSTRDLAAAMAGADAAIAASLDTLLGTNKYSKGLAITAQADAMKEVTKLIPTLTTFDQVMQLATGDMSGLTLAQKLAIAAFLDASVKVDGFKDALGAATKAVQLNDRMMDHLAKRTKELADRLDAIGPGSKQTTTYADEQVQRILGNIAGVYGDTGGKDQLAMQRKAMEDLIKAKEIELIKQREREARGGTWTGAGSVKGLLDQIEAAKKALGDLKLLQGYEKIAPGHAKELMELEKWYADQKKAVGNNHALLLILEKTYGEKRKAILEASVAQMLNAWKNIQEFVKSLDSTAMGLTPQAAMESARAQYIKDLALAKGGDLAAMERITADAQKYIELSKAMYGSGDAMSAIIAQIKFELLGLDPTKKGLPVKLPAGDSALLKQGGESFAELQGIRKELKDTKELLARLMEQGNKATKDQTNKLSEVIRDGANKQAAATTNAAAMSQVN